MGAWTNDEPRELTVGIPGGAHIQIGPGDVIQVFNSSNQLVAQISETGIQTFGPTDGSQVAMVPGIGPVASELKLTPGGGNVSPAIVAGATAGGPATQPQLVMLSPQQTLTTPNSRSEMTLIGADNTIPASQAIVSADAVTLNGLAGTNGVGEAVLAIGGNQGSPATVQLLAGTGAGLQVDQPLHEFDIFGTVLGIFCTQIQLSGGPDILGAYQDFSSAAIISDAGGTYNKGSTTYQARYLQIGKRVHYTGRVTINTGGGFNTGTGVWAFLLPVAAQAAQIGTSGVYVLDNGTANYAAVGRINNTGTHFNVYQNNTVFALGASGPGTPWATNDIAAEWSFVYEAA